MEPMEESSSEEEEEEAMVPTSVDHSLLLQQVTAARQAMQQRAPERAAPLLLRAVHTVPDLLPELEDELAQALSEYAGALVGQGKAREALWLLDGATRSLPQAKLLWLEQGRLCFRLRQHLRALCSFQRALALDPRFHAAFDALESLKSLSVDRWHFRMLNDRPRNEAYRRALQRVVVEEASRLGRKPVVLDIGTGTGLLALLALEAGAERVYACETNPVLANMARAIVAAHGPGAQDGVVVINKASQDLLIGEDLPAPVDIVVTELVDSGLLGEHILPVLCHARAALLRPGGRVIPHSARVTASVIASPDVRRRARLLSAVTPLLFPPSVSEVAPSVGVDEAYTCESLSSLSHTPLTGPLEVTAELSLVDDASARFHTSIDLEATDDGLADAVAVHFELDLVPPMGLGEEERIAFSTAPGRPQNGWDQGLYFLLPTPVNHSHGSSSDLRMHAGGAYRLEAAIIDDQLAFRLTDKATGGRAAVSRGFPPAGADEGSAVAPPTPTLEVGEADLAQLNDAPRLRAYGEALGVVVARALARAGGVGERARVVEWSGDFSALGLVALRAPGVGAVTVLTGSDESAALLHAWMDKATAAAAAAAAAAAPAPTASVRLLRFRAGSGAAVVAPALLGLREEAQAQEQEAGSPPLVLLHDLVEGSGLIRQGALQEALLARDLLGPHALAPQAFRVVVQALEAPALAAQNRLDPANTLGIRLEALDGLGVSTFRELDLAAAMHEGSCAPLSQPCAALGVDLRTARVTEGDEVLARARVSLPVTAPGALQALGFWFELQLAEGVAALSTGPVPLAPVDAGEGEGGGGGSSYRQGAVLLAEERAVQPGQRVEVEVVCTLSRGVDMFLVAPIG